MIQLEEDKMGLALSVLMKEELFNGENKALLINNCMGICSDKGSNMLTKFKGLSNHLQKDMLHLYLSHDYSHKFNLIASRNFQKL